MQHGGRQGVAGGGVVVREHEVAASVGGEAPPKATVVLEQSAWKDLYAIVDGICRRLISSQLELVRSNDDPSSVGVAVNIGVRCPRSRWQ